MNRPYDQPIKKFLEENIAPSSRVLDVGCGTGWTGLFLAKIKRHCQVDGIDLNALKVHRANALFNRAKLNHLVVCHTTPAEALVKRFGRTKFNAAVSVHSLHHYDDVVRALKQIKIVLKPGGKLLLGELDQEYGETVDDCPRYSIKKIRQLIANSGLKIQSVQNLDPGILLVLAVKP